MSKLYIFLLTLISVPYQYIAKIKGRRERKSCQTWVNKLGSMLRGYRSIENRESDVNALAGVKSPPSKVNAPNEIAVTKAGMLFSKKLLNCIEIKIVIMRRENKNLSYPTGSIQCSLILIVVYTDHRTYHDTTRTELPIRRQQKNSLVPSKYSTCQRILQQELRQTDINDSIQTKLKSGCIEAKYSHGCQSFYAVLSTSKL